MFIIIVTYKKPRTEIDPYMEAHLAHIRQQFAEGHFLFTGRKVPRTGGIILSKVKTREQLDEIIEQDPFYKHRLVDFDVIEFSVTATCSELQFLREW